jgi:SAM-dependent methyltransferase
MDLTTSGDIRTFLNIYISSVALGTALELGLFWKLAVKPLNVTELSQLYNIPSHRIHALCELLIDLNLLERNNQTYIPSPLARKTILTTYNPESWAFLAQEAKNQLPVMINLSSTIVHPQSVWKAQGLKPPNWLVQIKNDPKYADRFTKTLYDLHRPFAEKLAQVLNIDGVKRMLDVGGGSGVVSLALLKRHSDLTAVVIDLENVCKTGREIAKKTGIGDRITYQVCDFINDELPIGFDMAIQCDAGEFNIPFFKKVRNSLNDGGRLVIITNIDDESDQLTHSKYHRTFLRSMSNFHTSLRVPKFSRGMWSIEEVKELLSQAKCSSSSEDIWENGTVIIQSFR